jgi:hypothetical protein
MKLSSSAIIALVSVVALGGAVCRAAAQAPQAQPNHEDLINAINSVQESVSSVQSTVNNIPPAWSQTLTAAQRFVLVLGGNAVLDKETGLVWERSPSSTMTDWSNALRVCNGQSLGNRKGWRLPTIQELASLVDPTRSGPALPAGHPFVNVNLGPSGYWSATTDATNPAFAWGVEFNTGDIFGGQTKASFIFVWCLRSGGHGLDLQ